MNTSDVSSNRFLHTCPPSAPPFYAQQLLLNQKSWQLQLAVVWELGQSEILGLVISALKKVEMWSQPLALMMDEDAWTEMSERKEVKWYHGLNIATLPSLKAASQADLSYEKNISSRLPGLQRVEMHRRPLPCTSRWSAVVPNVSAQTSGPCKLPRFSTDGQHLPHPATALFAVLLQHSTCGYLESAVGISGFFN